MSVRQCGSRSRKSFGRRRLDTAAISATSPPSFMQRRTCGGHSLGQLETARRTGTGKGEHHQSPGIHIRRRRRRSRRRHSLAQPLDPGRSAEYSGGLGTPTTTCSRSGSWRRSSPVRTCRRSSPMVMMWLRSTTCIPTHLRAPRTSPSGRGSTTARWSKCMSFSTHDRSQRCSSINEHASHQDDVLRTGV
jgi:hypothetical protein